MRGTQVTLTEGMKGRVVGEGGGIISAQHGTNSKHVFLLILNLTKAFQNFKMLLFSEISSLSKKIPVYKISKPIFVNINSSLKKISSSMNTIIIVQSEERNTGKQGGGEKSRGKKLPT